MDLLRPSDLRELLESPAEPSVSIYMPAHRAGPETRQDPIRLKNLLGQAQERLEETGLRAPEAADLLSPAHELLDDGEFWRHQGDGLALFLAPERGRVFRLPVAFDELVVAGDRFHVKPLVSLLSGDGRFLVLALSQNQIRLLQGTRQTVAEVQLENVPSSLREAAVHREARFLNYYVGSGFRSGGRQSAIFHGHGTEEDDEIVRKYLRQIDQGLRDAIADERAPLVLAAVRREADMYREVSSYPSIHPEIVHGNPDEKRDDELHGEAWEVVGSHLDRARRQAVEMFGDRAGTGLAVRGVEEVVPAAHHGRVETLWTAVGIQRWGLYDEETASADVRERPRPGDHDLLDLAAEQTLLNGGTVYAVDPSEVPGGAPIAALLRY